MNNEDDRNALLTLLQVLRSNTEFYMRQQWAITNYSFLIYGAIIGIIKSFEPNILFSEKIISFSISTLMCAAASFFILSLRNSLNEARAMVDDIYNGIPALKDIIDKRCKKTTPVSWLLIVILIFGDIAVLWVVLKIQ